MQNIQVGPISYKVIEDGTCANNDEFGATYHDRSEIHLATTLSEYQRRSTLLHEVLHAVASIAGIGTDEKLTEEQFIGRIEATLLDTLGRNPHLLQELELMP